jgi:hypothetical protein
MQTKQILTLLDQEISKLKKVRALLAGVQPMIAPAIAKKAKPAKRQISPEGKARIVAAQKKRWAAKRKSIALVRKVAA